jgi:hypothetical protein
MALDDFKDQLVEILFYKVELKLTTFEIRYSEAPETTGA